MSMYFSVLSDKLASNRRNFMERILSRYDHSVMAHVKFQEDVIGCREVIALLNALISICLYDGSDVKL